MEILKQDLEKIIEEELIELLEQTQPGAISVPRRPDVRPSTVKGSGGLWAPPADQQDPEILRQRKKQAELVKLQTALETTSSPAARQTILTQIKQLSVPSTSKMKGGSAGAQTYGLGTKPKLGDKGPAEDRPSAAAQRAISGQAMDITGRPAIRGHMSELERLKKQLELTKAPRLRKRIEDRIKEIEATSAEAAATETRKLSLKDFKDDAYKKMEQFNKAVTKFLYSVEKFDRGAELDTTPKPKKPEKKPSELVKSFGAVQASDVETARKTGGTAGAMKRFLKPKGERIKFGKPIREQKDPDTQREELRALIRKTTDPDLRKELIAKLKQPHTELERVVQLIATGKMTPELRAKYPSVVKRAEEYIAKDTRRDLEQRIEAGAERLSPLQGELKKQYDNLLKIKKERDQALANLRTHVAQTSGDEQGFYETMTTWADLINYLDPPHMRGGEKARTPTAAADGEKPGPFWKDPGITEVKELNEVKGRERYKRTVKTRKIGTGKSAVRIPTQVTRTAPMKGKKQEWYKEWTYGEKTLKDIKDKIVDQPDKYGFLTAGAAGGGTTAEATAEREAVTGAAGLFGGEGTGSAAAVNATPSPAGAASAEKAAEAKGKIFQTDAKKNAFLAYMTPPYKWAKLLDKIEKKAKDYEARARSCGATVAEDSVGQCHDGADRQSKAARKKAEKSYIYWDRLTTNYEKGKKGRRGWGEIGYPSRYTGTVHNVLRALQKETSSKNIKILRGLLKEKTGKERLRMAKDYRWLLTPRYYNQLKGGKELAAGGGAEQEVAVEEPAAEEAGNFKGPADLDKVENPGYHVERRSVVNFYENVNTDPPTFKYGMPEGKKDRLGKREGFEEGSLDKVAQDFFAYTDWTEYKQDNKQDLGGPTKRGAGTERWSGIEGPTLHPMHVGFATQEFLANINPENYIAVLYTVGKGSDPSLRPGKVTSVFKKAATTSEYRNKFFGDEVAESAIDQTGVIT